MEEPALRYTQLGVTLTALLDKNSASDFGVRHNDLARPAAYCFEGLQQNAGPVVITNDWRRCQHRDGGHK